MREWKDLGCTVNHVFSNLVPRAHVHFGQHQDTELWNNQFPETKILGLLVKATRDAPRVSPTCRQNNNFRLIRPSNVWFGLHGV